MKRLDSSCNCVLRGFAIQSQRVIAKTVVDHHESDGSITTLCHC